MGGIYGQVAMQQLCAKGRSGGVHILWVVVYVGDADQEDVVVGSHCTTGHSRLNGSAYSNQCTTIQMLLVLLLLCYVHI